CPSSVPSSPSSSESLRHEFGEYVAVSPACDSDSDECCVCDDPEVEALLHGNRLQGRFLREAKEFIRRYKPGDWVEGVCDTKAGDYVLPEVTTLLLVGPRGAGKSTLVNRITQVFDKDDDPDAPDQAHISCKLFLKGLVHLELCNCSLLLLLSFATFLGNSKSVGTSFLWEYRVPRNSNSICIYDTRSMFNNREMDCKMLQRWMTKGLSHGEMVTWGNDDYNKIQNIKLTGRRYNFLPCKTRKVNFAIFVVNGVSVLQSIDDDNKDYINLLHETFMCPFLAFGDDKPAVVVTHGDRLSLQQRAHVRNELVELFGIPLQQIFDIPGFDDYETDLSVLDMLCYCIQHAEQNFPIKINYLSEMHGRETTKIAERLTSLDATIEAAIIFLCTVILLLRVSDKLLQW
ncbi:hypothetical protein GUJ93_ZPchr0005g15536, partial [Zizania palustris]